MKKFIANISRITITYSKFLIMIMVLSSNGTPVKAEDSFTYLKCGVDYLRLTGNYISNNYNIRTKKFLNSYTINPNLSDSFWWVPLPSALRPPLPPPVRPMSVSLASPGPLTTQPMIETVMGTSMWARRFSSSPTVWGTLNC